MNILEAISNHKSIRKYRPDPIPEDLLAKILNAGIRASSSGNMQTYSVILTSDKELKQKLYSAHFEQSMVLEAPMVITFCADFHRMRLWLEQSEANPNFDNFMSFMIAAIDATLASQNMALAAESLGLGICYMGTTLANCRVIGELLKLPQNVVPVVGFTMGYPDESIETRDRLPLDGLVHYNTYQDYSATEIQRIYSKREEAGMKRYLSHPQLAKEVKENNIKNLAQVYTHLKYTKESHIQYSQTVLNYLKDQNFFEQ